MTPRELIEAIIRQYENLQKVHENFRDRNDLKRKSNHIIGSFLEDIIAAYISDYFQNLDLEVEIWIDQVFSFGRNQKFKPDITIIRSIHNVSEIIGFIEVKDSANPFRWIDAAGNNNTSIDYINNRITKLGIIRDQHDSIIRYKLNNQDNTITINANTKIDLVLISDQLFSVENHRLLREYCDTIDVNHFLNLHIFLTGMHPNTRINNQRCTAEILIARIQPDQLHFESFNQRLAAIAQI
jgi:hypothetical protein